ncbi:MAG: hypothetical protein Q7S89_00305 [bacterium]|nr:hypothetical protein [bacterium]
MSKYIVVLGALILIIIGFYYFSSKVSQTFVFEEDTVIETDLAVAKGEQTTIKNGATLTIQGNLTVDGAIACSDGGLSLVVEGTTQVNGALECEGGGAITVVAKGPIAFSSNAEVVSDGSLQIVFDASALASTDAEVEAIFKETGEDTGTGTRIGPMIEGGKVGGSVSQNIETPTSGIPAFARLFGVIGVAEAQTASDKEGNEIPGVVISGTWTIGEGGAPPSGIDVQTPDKKINKIILNFNFGANGTVALQNFHLVGPKGRAGESDVGKSCNARGKDGEDAFRFRVRARNITLDEFRLELGDGGDGGEAETTNDCDPGIANGGKGGEAGNFKMTAEGEIQINSFHIVPGRGGSGAEATAHGKDGVNACPGTKGGDATATGGIGGKNKKELAAAGVVAGIGNVTIDPVVGGFGGDATANPGKGGSGTACKCAGGAGGKGIATAGKGGDASLFGIAGTSEGGDGGHADSQGAQGGNGGSCGVNQPTGGVGGKGGDSKSTFGTGGSAQTNGTDGEVRDETGGNGGNGGDGCGPGNGGKGGVGKPPGTDGAKGKLICTEEKPKTTPDTGGTNGTPSTGSGTMQGGGTTGVGATGGTAEGRTIQAIQFKGKYLPLEQLIIEDEVGCGADHWHAAEGMVVATDGTEVFDPGPQCGFGKLSDVPLVSVEIR